MVPPTQSKQAISDAILFDRDEVEHLNDLSERPRRLRGSKLLWVDVHRGSEIGADEVAAALGIVAPAQERIAI